MRRMLAYFILVAVNVLVCVWDGAACLAKEAGTAIEGKDLYARSAVLMDADSGRVLFEKEGETPLPMASTTKIMTCIVTLENGNLQDSVEVSGYAASMPKVRLNIHKGEHYLLFDLLHSLMLESHNDAAVAIAEHIGGSVEGFAAMMNKKAKEIGSQNTCFITPNGLDAKQDVPAEGGGSVTAVHSTTARDLALIMSYCIKKSPQKEMFLKITRTGTHSFSNQEGTRSFSCNNHNAFLQMMDGALSGKTGFTGNAGYCYVGALERDGRTFVVALLACGWPNNKGYKWKDTKKLMEYGIANYNLRDLSQETLKEEWLKDIPVQDAQTGRLFEQAATKVYIREETGAPKLLMREGEQVEVACSVKSSLTAPVQSGQEVGVVRYRIDGNVIWERKICVKDTIEKTNFAWFMKMVLGDYLFN